MKIADLTELATRNLRESILRNSLTTVGIAVGVASLVAMLSLGVGLQQLINRRLERNGLFDTVLVRPRTGFGPAGQLQRNRDSGAGQNANRNTDSGATPAANPGTPILPRALSIKRLASNSRSCRVSSRSIRNFALREICVRRRRSFDSGYQLARFRLFQ